MAIHVIGQDKSRLKQCSCEHCAALMTYTLADTKMDYFTDYDGGRDQYRYLNCPQCSSKVVVPLF